MSRSLNRHRPLILTLLFHEFSTPPLLCVSPSRLCKSAISSAIAQWGPGKFDAYWNTCISYFANSKHFTPEQIAKIKTTPSKIIHGQNDVAYPLELSQRVFNVLRKGGVDAELVQIPGATHYVCVTASEE